MSEISKLEKRMDKQFDNLTALMSNFANEVYARFDQQDARFDQQDPRFDRIEERLDKLEASHNRLLNTIDGFVKRIDDYETEMAA